MTTTPHTTDPGTTQPAPMGPVTAVTTCLRKYATFSGRASRAEFWWFYLFTLLVCASAVATPVTLALIQGTAAPYGTNAVEPLTAGEVALYLAVILVPLTLVLPALAVGTRRLHDLDRSGWWQALGLIPFVGPLAHLVVVAWWSQVGDPGSNRFGPRPGNEPRRPPTKEATDLLHGQGFTYPIPNPRKPSALLVPPFVLDRVAETRTRKRVLGTVAAVTVLTLGAAAGAFGWAYTTQQDLTVAQQEKKAADDRVAKYIDVARYYDGLTARELSLKTMLGSDILYSKTTERIFTTTPGSAQVDSVKYVPGAPCPGPDPFAARAALGCVEVTGTAADAGVVGDYVDALNETQDPDLIIAAFVSRVESSAKSSASEFTISVNYTAEALSYKFLTEEEAATLTPGAATSATTSGTTPAQDGAGQ